MGNDFVVVDCITQNVFFSPDLIRRLADRNTGIGFDQLLIVEAPYDPETDFHYRIFNSDGGEVEQCGNGARCFARFVRMKGLTNKYKINVRSMQYLFHGKNQENAEIEEKIDKELKEIVGKKETEKKKTYVKKKVADDVPF